MILTGDCVEVMAGMEPESIDAICTDPPYGLEFMGKEWDNLGRESGSEWSAKWATGKDWRGVERQRPGRLYNRSSHETCQKCRKQKHQHDAVRCPEPEFIREWHKPRQMQAMTAWHQQWAQAAYRVAKPSAYLLAFGGTRTVHRMTVALEDAGWIIRDMLVWAYASGFPKSKASLKPAWEPIVMARKPGPLRDLAIDACRIPGEPWTAHDATGLASVKFFTDGDAPVIHKEPHNLGRWPANVILTDPIFDGGVEGVVGGGEARGEVAVNRNRDPKKHNVFFGSMAAPTYDGGYGDSGTYSRFFLIPKSSRSDREPVLGGLPEQHAGVGIRQTEVGEYEERVYEPDPHVIASYLRGHREAMSLSKPEMDRRLGTVTLYSWFEGRPAGTQLPTPDVWRRLKDILAFDDTHDVEMTTTRAVDRKLLDGALPARRQNHHPTVKPTDLMRHLVRLVTPTGGTVLDPFLGSGTTGLAAEMEGFAWIGIEREAEYVAIAEARLNGTQRGLGLDVGAPTPTYSPPPDSKMPPPKFRESGTPKGWSGGWSEEETP